MDSRQDQGAESALSGECPLERVLKMIGEKYKVLILWHLRAGLLRWGEVRRLVRSAADRMLSRQMRELERLIARIVYPAVPLQAEERLTG